MTPVALFIIVWIILTFYVPYRFKERGIQEMQTIATTFGILGTFIGIIWGLINFDTSDIQNAVPLLLEGLKFAFVTSIAGMIISLLIGLFPQIFGHRTKNGAGVIEDKDKSEPELLSEILSEIRVLNKNIAGDEETTLVSQIQKLRISFIDKQDELKNAFNEFARQMAENNVTALIAAVQQVMDDFSTQINDHLGENFKRLSEGVENLVIWQDKYREQLSVSAEVLKKAGDSIDTSSESMTTFTERAKDFDHIANQLKESLETIGSSMTGLKNLADNLEKSGEGIRNEMKEMTQQNIKELGENLKGISEKLVEDYSYIQKMMQTVMNKDKSNNE